METQAPVLVENRVVSHELRGRAERPPIEVLKERSNWKSMVTLEKKGHENPLEASKKEVERIFSECEQARTRTLSVRRSDDSDHYLFGVEPPTSGEVRTIKAQVADIRNALSPGEAYNFDGWLDGQLKIYQPYQEGEKKLSWITVPLEKGGKMTLWTGGTDQFEGVAEGLEKGSFKTKGTGHIVTGTYDARLLKRFEGLITLPVR